MPYRPTTTGRHAGSILPVYTPLGSSILPRYASIGEAADSVIVTKVISEEPTPADLAANKAAIQAGVLFFIGLALGYVLGGTTGSFGK